MAKKNHGGIVYDTIVPGDFYISHDPGGWTDRITGIHIPGSRVRIDPNTRMIEAVESIPDPVQIPHYKMIVNVKDKDRKVQERTEVPFDRPDEYPLHDGLNMALSTGIIQHIEDEDVEDLYPNAWAARREHYVYDDEKKVMRPMGDMMDDFHAKRKSADAEVLAIAEAAFENAQASGTENPPPPPPSRTVKR